MIKVIAFDLVGVLLKENSFILDEKQDKLERTFGKEMTDEDVINYGLTIGFNSEDEVRDGINYIVSNIYDIKYNPIMLKQIYPELKLLVASNHIKAINNLLEKEFENIFDDILISNYVNAFKPNSNFYEKLIEMSKVSPSEILFLDDNIDNIKGAEKLGIKTLLVNKNDNIHENIIKILK